MSLKLKLQTLIAFLFLAALVLQSCAFPASGEAGVAQVSSTPGEVPTWTPRPEDLTPLPTPTRPATATATSSVTPTLTSATPREPTPRTVSVSITGGNLNVRRGPSLDYNYVGVLYDGDTILATGRDRISRWIRVQLPSQPDAEGWITTETKYTQISGDISNLPFIQTEPAAPAFIRNCTKHEIWILPADVYLLPKYEAPYNEERFWVGIFQVYDLENPENKPIDEIDLSEGQTIDIRYNWAGEKSKCE